MKNRRSFRRGAYGHIAALGLLLFSAAPRAAGAAVTRSAVFAGGCFWCMEHDMKAIPGVVSVQSGYTGGHVNHPTYEQVSSERSGHYEAVKVTFDPARIPYTFLLNRYWKLIDPTDAGGQFCDRGPSYGPAIFVDGPEEQNAAAQSKAMIAKTLPRAKIVVPILPLKAFWPAEDYHRDYAKTHKADYEAYRAGCGRDAVLKRIWAGRAN